MVRGISLLSDLSDFFGQEHVKVIKTTGEIVEIAGSALVRGILDFQYVAVIG